ncbi:MAG: 8-amino-7-oxononanoate synthase [Planctomycetes bacterium]|nr:8-amino-7-oxononanoate synthase [Planctomycetota bacterium]
MGKIDEYLEQAKTKSQLRFLRPAGFRREGRICFKGREFFDFSSNDYLGLSGHAKLKEASVKAIEQFGVGSGASRLLSGDLKIHHELEERVACFKGKEAALVFNSGYQANVGIINALYGRGDVIFADKLCHASIWDGIKLSGAELFRFGHNDVGQLEKLLKGKADKFKRRLIVTETVFSMDGDKPPLKEMVELKERHGCELMVDEAHATGIFGADGGGVVSEFGLVERVDLIMGTFSKALGSFGAYLAGSAETIEYLINTCRSFIYSTALPAGIISANIASLELVRDEPFRRKELLENAYYFRNELRKKGFKVAGTSQIIPLVVGDTEKTILLSEKLCERGYWSLPIRPPTVPAGQSRLRFSLTYNHSKEILEALANDIAGISKS